MRRESDNVNVRTHGIRAATRNGGTGQLVDIEVQHGEPELQEQKQPLPYLEDVMVIAKKYPYSALGIMIAVASVVIAATVTIGVAMFTAFFLMYGDVRAMKADQATMLKEIAEVRGQVQVIKTIHSATLARQDVMTTLMSKENQETVNAYDRTRPRIPLPEDGERK